MSMTHEPLPGEEELRSLPSLDEFAAYVPLRVAVLKRLKAAIVEGILKPGTLLSENAIAAQLSVSRTPVREAIRVLEQEGLVSILPGRKVIVSVPTAQDIDEIYDIRLILETEAVRRLAMHLPEFTPRLKESVQRQRAALEAGDLAGLYRLNAEFHKLITSGLRNNRLHQFLEAVHDSISRLRFYSLEDEEWAAEGVAEHEQLVSLLEQGNAEDAARLLEHHLKAARKILQDRFIEGGEDDVS